MMPHPNTAPLPAWDCHAHLFGPYADYPLAEPRSYTPPEATEPAYLAMLSALGLQRGVLVHPSAYGLHYDRVLDTLARHPQLRGVLVATAATTLPLHELRGMGVRALRFSHRSGAAQNFAGSASFDDLLSLAPRMADAGLHAELWTDCQALPSISETLSGLPVPVVIDHMGGFDWQSGVASPAYQHLLRLLATGRVWVKLCAYRNLLKAPPAEAHTIGKGFVAALLDANVERLVWGSDWPHLNIAQPPETLALLAQFQDWVESPLQREQILRINPGHLYD